MMTQHSYKIFFYVALHCEAKPLIAYYKLKKDLSIQAFAVYGHDDVCLTITGLGKTAMAAGIAYTQAVFKSSFPVLVNVGIAGHRDYALGDLYLASKIVDLDSQRCFYPPLVTKTDIVSSSVFTKATSQLTYDHTALCDMEASAFYETAIRFTSSELVQCLKVVSDNQQQPAINLQTEQVSNFISKQIDSLIRFIKQLSELPITEPEIPLFDELIQRYHFTVSAKARLQSLLHHWSVLTDNQPLMIDAIQFKHSKDVLGWLELRLKSI